MKKEKSPYTGRDAIHVRHFHIGYRLPENFYERKHTAFFLVLGFQQVV